MNRWLVATLGLFLATAALPAHHLWIVPETPDGSKATVVFSDTLDPDRPELLEKIAQTKLWKRDSTGKETPLAWKKGKDAYLLDTSGKGVRSIAGICVYGVETHDHREREQVEPYLLAYYPKLVLGKGGSPGPWSMLPLEIMSVVTGGELRVQVLFRGKPAPNAEMRVQAPSANRVNLETDEKGELKIALKKPGNYGLQTRFIEPRAGEHAGKKYVEVRHYASLVIPVSAESVVGKQ